MSKKSHWIMALILLLSLPALACGAFGGDEAEATAVPVVEEQAAESGSTTGEEETPLDATAVPENIVEEAPTNNNDAPPLAASSLELSAISELPFNSYRVVMMMIFTGVKADGEEVTQAIDADFAFISEPLANSMSLTFTGIADVVGGDTIDMAQIEDTSYMVIPEMGCVTTQAGNKFENPFVDMFDPYEFLSDLEKAKFEGDETINGIQTRHYSLDEAAFMTSENNIEGIEEAEGHIYIAKEGDFLVSMVLDAIGKIDFFDEGVEQDGKLHIEFNLTDIDALENITVPEGCEEQASGETAFPMMDDAFEVSSFGGLISYKTGLPLEDVLAFYEDALAAEGWVKDESGSIIGGGNALVGFTREGETLNLTIGPDEASGGSYVVLLSETEE